MIILEGSDGAGKSTLLTRLCPHLSGWTIVLGKGPPQSDQEMRERLDTWLSYPPRTIFDRHPVISDPIYARVFGRKSVVDYIHYHRMHLLKPLIIYCRAPHDHLTPQTGSHDTPEHVARLQQHHAALLTAYDSTFEFHHTRYTWDNFPDILAAVQQHVKECT